MWVRVRVRVRDEATDRDRGNQAGHGHRIKAKPHLIRVVRARKGLVVQLIG